MTVIKQLTDPLSHRRAERIPHQELHVESGEGPAKHRRPRAAEPYATTDPARSLARSLAHTAAAHTTKWGTSWTASRFKGKAAYN